MAASLLEALVSSGFLPLGVYPRLGGRLRGRDGPCPGRALFLYTPAIAGRFVERMMEGPKSQEERDQQLKEYGESRSRTASA